MKKSTKIFLYIGITLIFISIAYFIIPYLYNALNKVEKNIDADNTTELIGIFYLLILYYVPYIIGGIIAIKFLKYKKKTKEYSKISKKEKLLFLLPFWCISIALIWEKIINWILKPILEPIKSSSGMIYFNALDVTTTPCCPAKTAVTITATTLNTFSFLLANIGLIFMFMMSYYILHLWMKNKEPRKK